MSEQGIAYGVTFQSCTLNPVGSIGIRLGWPKGPSTSVGERGRCGHLVAKGGTLYGGDCWDCMDRWERAHFREMLRGGTHVHVATSRREYLIRRWLTTHHLSWLSHMTGRRPARLQQEYDRRRGSAT